MYNSLFPRRRGLDQQPFGPDVCEGCTSPPFIRAPGHLLSVLLCLRLSGKIWGSGQAAEQRDV